MGAFAFSSPARTRRAHSSRWQGRGSRARTRREYSVRWTKGARPSRAAEHAQLLAGLAGDLERTLESIDGVLSARVQLNLPEPDPFRGTEPAKATASVLLEHRGSAPPIGAADVQRLLAAASAGSPRRRSRLCWWRIRDRPLRPARSVARPRRSDRGGAILDAFASVLFGCAPRSRRRSRGDDASSVRSSLAPSRCGGRKDDVISIRGLTKAFAVTRGGTRTREVLRDVSVEVPTGCLYGLIGPGASGKSLLLKLITGLLPADRGTVVVDGEEIMSLAELRLQEFRKKIGMLFQNNALFDHPSRSARTSPSPSGASTPSPRTKCARAFSSASLAWT